EVRKFGAKAQPAAEIVGHFEAERCVVVRTRNPPADEGIVAEGRERLSTKPRIPGVAPGDAEILAHHGVADARGLAGLLGTDEVEHRIGKRTPAHAYVPAVAREILARRRIEFLAQAAELGAAGGGRGGLPLRAEEIPGFGRIKVR